MRAGETVIVGGADGDRAQFSPFEWPKYAVLWVSVGCGHVCSPMYLPPAPPDATAEARDEVARAYVRAVRDAPPGSESAVSSWLKLVERAAHVPCALVLACGGVRVTAVPIFTATWNRRGVVTVVGRGVYRKVPLVGDVEKSVSRVLGLGSLDAVFRVVKSGTRTIDLHPLERCALCDSVIRSSLRTFVTASDGEGPVGSWLPRIGVCSACPARSLRIWRTFEFTIGNAPREPRVPLFGESQHESVWQANARVFETIALALVYGAARGACTPLAGFPALVAATLCDMKLLRIVAESAALPAPKIGAWPRAISALIEAKNA